jgi:hypothetical protein
MSKKLPVNCPSCEEKLKVERLGCKACETAVEGNFDLPLLSMLDPEEQDFIIRFMQYSGSIKEISAHLGYSYPTVRNILNDLIEKINKLQQA